MVLRLDIINSTQNMKSVYIEDCDRNTLIKEITTAFSNNVLHIVNSKDSCHIWNPRKVALVRINNIPLRGLETPHQKSVTISITSDPRNPSAEITFMIDPSQFEGLAQGIKNAYNNKCMFKIDSGQITYLINPTVIDHIEIT